MGGKFIDLTGQRFNRLVVSKSAGKTKNGAYLWECLCDCGKTSYATGNSLKTGATKSCGCYIRDVKKGNTNTRLPYGESSFNNLYYLYKRSAQKRQISFEISKGEFRVLTQGVCVYCGNSPSTTNSKYTYYGEYTYNGIDRVDNSKGYVLDNCETCCSVCNYAKKTKSKEEFLLWIDRVYRNVHKAGL